jgi:hypothetical protein
MKKLQSIGFSDERLYGGIDEYARSRGISFSRATTELADAGLNFFNRTDSINPEVLMEKLRSYEAQISLLQKSLESAQKEIERLWKLSDLNRGEGGRSGGSGKNLKSKKKK